MQKFESAYPLPSAHMPRLEVHPLLALLRRYQRTENPVVRKLLRQAHKLLQISSACDIPLDCSQLGLGLLLPHRAIGVVIHPAVKMGINCCVFHGTTIGSNNNDGLPELGDCVEVGPGAKIFGNIKIGDFVQIGAGAIVTRDVPAYSLVTGANDIRPNIKRFPSLSN
jgi:serine O-acetyltransferase